MITSYCNYFNGQFILHNIRFPQVSVASLLSDNIMFSDTLDLRKIRMYLSMGYEVIFKYKYSFIILIGKSEIDIAGCPYISKYSFEEVLSDLQICSKQDIHNYCYWARNNCDKRYPRNRSVILVSLTSEIFN